MPALTLTKLDLSHAEPSPAAPGEREKPAAASGFRLRVWQRQSQAFIHWGLRAFLPLLGGEGRGEGERLNSLLPRFSI